MKLKFIFPVIFLMCSASIPKAQSQIKICDNLKITSSIISNFAAHILNHRLSYFVNWSNVNGEKFALQSEFPEKLC
jgi:hypothetical protein